ncbi:hypothetical protein ACLOJK_029186 [Asimina triloba]
MQVSSFHADNITPAIVDNSVNYQEDAGYSATLSRQVKMKEHLENCSKKLF